MQAREYDMMIKREMVCDMYSVKLINAKQNWDIKAWNGSLSADVSPRDVDVATS